LRIQPNLRLRQRLLETLTTRNLIPREGIHVSDLVLCVRRSYFQRIDPKPPTEQTLAYYVDGARRDLVIKGLLGTRVQPSNQDGIWFSPDGFDENLEPIEVKTTRSSKLIQPHYVRQLAYYMVLSKKTRGHLLVQRVGFQTGAPFESLDLEFDEGDYKQYYDEMISRRDSLLDAMRERNPALARHVKRDPEYLWLCSGCPWKRECYEMDT
jgi:hypothetical protein